MKPTTPSLRKLGLLSYQSAFAANRSRFKIGLWARQTGKDHTATAEAVLDCFHNPGTTWIIVAASERQALESLNKAKEWAAILQFEIADYHQAPANIPYSIARTASTEIKWSNGSRLIALPANPSTIRGYSANLILTEFAFHENPEALWRAIYPTISNPLRGGTKKLRIISTPNGLNNKFAHLWHSNPNPNLNLPPSASSAKSAVNLLSSSNPVHPVQNSISLNSKLEIGNSKLSEVLSPTKNSKLKTQNSRDLKNLFFKSRVTIHDAIRGGLPLDPAELQSALNDPEAWAQEYLCEFMDNSTVLLPYDLIETCESEFATERSSLESLSASAIPGNNRPQLYAGIDFARKNHLTVCWILEKLPSSALNLFPSSLPSLPSVKNSPSALSASSANSAVFLTREVLCLRNTSTPDQIDQLLPRLKLCQHTALDYTGPGIGLGDFLIKQLGSYKLELCPFTSSLKAELFPRLAAAFESRELLIPIGRDIREDLHSIYRTVTNSGNIVYRAHATPDGHADRTTALALALRAAQTTRECPPPTSVGRRNSFLAERNPNRRNRYLPPERTIAIIY